MLAEEPRIIWPATGKYFRKRKFVSVATKICHTASGRFYTNHIPQSSKKLFTQQIAISMPFGKQGEAYK